MSQVTVSFSAQGSGIYVKRAGLGWKELPQLKKIGAAGSTSVKLADVSTLSSPGGYEEVKALMKKLKPVSLQGVWDPSDATANYLQTSNATYPQPLEEFMVIASDPNLRTVKFSAYVTDFDTDLSANDVGMFNMTLTPTGAPSFSYGSSPA